MGMCDEESEESDDENTFTDWLDDQSILKGRVCGNVNDVERGRMPKLFPASHQVSLRSGDRNVTKIAARMDKCDKHITVLTQSKKLVRWPGNPRTRRQ